MPYPHPWGVAMTRHSGRSERLKRIASTSISPTYGGEDHTGSVEAGSNDGRRAVVEMLADRRPGRPPDPIIIP